MVDRGDLIIYPVCKQSDCIDQVIGKAQFDLGQNVARVQFEHCEISKGNERVYAARWPRTGEYPIDRSRPFFVYHIDDILPVEIDEGMAWLEAHNGELYDLLALITAGLISSKQRQVCSTEMAGYIRATGKAKAFLTGFVMPDQILQMVSATRVLEIK